MRTALIAPLWVCLLTFCIPSISLAQEQFKSIVTGDWSTIENAVQRSAELSSSEVVWVASTEALNGRKATFGISRCGRYDLGFAVQTDSEFFHQTHPEHKIRDTKIVFGKVLPSETPEMSPIFLHQGDVQYFSAHAGSMVLGARFILCPSYEESPGCLTFSLRGFTVALKMVCPKR
jgi:hypothetical protein